MLIILKIMTASINNPNLPWQERFLMPRLSGCEGRASNDRLLFTGILKAVYARTPQSTKIITNTWTFRALLMLKENCVASARVQRIDLKNCSLLLYHFRMDCKINTTIPMDGHYMSPTLRRTRCQRLQSYWLTNILMHCATQVLSCVRSFCQADNVIATDWFLSHKWQPSYSDEQCTILTSTHARI